MTTEHTHEFRLVAPGDAALRPLLDDLAIEYHRRYGPNNELARFPDSDFSPPDGGFLVLVENGETTAGGAFRRHDESTAELKRIWTHPSHRRRGLARLVVRELEREAAARGYQRVVLSTGPRQPEAIALYLAGGYRPLFDVTAAPETVGEHVFDKTLV
ncbi:GNAT family N-acetyltransferase [Planotetraspora kaengkrachanensis]|uniref:N-acetyltransferase n=1 Tax=Planotetraspora kaengkrachanensis TaxID=575193 RepID=A0A8J3M1P0_9ACTN|nr:GNAT family N-acetyltransferase [Planotetraspora kaengkrachanensis]GIG77391.1 N-acetyltransferase [Planotetraspora kaengkrachanensis]